MTNAKHIPAKQYVTFLNSPADRFGRYERWGWSADKIGCGGGYKTEKEADAAARAAIAKAKDGAA